MEHIETKNLSYYLKKSQNLKSNKNFSAKIKIAFLSSFTIDGLPEIVCVKCAENNIDCVSYNGPYNQYAQQILDKESDLYKFQPDITFVIIDNRTIFGDLFYDSSLLSVSERKKTVKDKVENLIQLTTLFSNQTKSNVVVSNIFLPHYTTYGISESKIDYGLKNMIQDFNSILESKLKNESSQHIIDYNSFVSKFGEINVFDFKQYFSGDIKIAFDYMPYFADEIMSFVKPFVGKNKKCIVLDLDNTLWGGIIGEDGFDGIKLGNSPSGIAFVEFQKYLLSLNKRGIILAINSKNNKLDAMKVIKEHPNMILKEENFATFQINWNDKVTNMKEIARELNIGLDSIVFFDDDKINREIMKKAIPEVYTVDLPDEASNYVSALQKINDFNVLKITDEDQKRAKTYSEQRKRNEFAKTRNLEEFLKDLEIQIDIKPADSFTIPRISQLTLKTNQFNLTTKRYQESEIKQFVNDEKFIVNSVNVKDKFGDNGITSVFIIKKNFNEWILDTFLLSCRVMGRDVEKAIMSFILSEAKKHDISVVKGQFIQTEKNHPSSSFFLDCGFTKEGNFWIFNLEDKIKTPKYISINKKNNV